MPVEDIFVFARKRMDNKGFGARIKNSAKLHSLRSAMSGKGSALSKAATVAGMITRSAFKLIPVPMVGDLLGAAQKTLEGKARGFHRSRRKGQAAAANDLENKVKFALKELTVEDLDRFRWKLKESIEALNKKAGAFDNLLKEKLENNMPCHAYLEMAEAVAQAERRFDRLDELCHTMITVLTECRTWCGTQNALITGFKNQYTDYFAEAVAKESRQIDNLEAATPGQGMMHGHIRHMNCEHYCYFNSLAESDNWAQTRQGLAAFVREVSAPFEAESFLTLDGKIYKTEKYDSQTGEKL